MAIDRGALRRAQRIEVLRRRLELAEKNVVSMTTKVQRNQAQLASVESRVASLKDGIERELGFLRAQPETPIPPTPPTPSPPGGN